MLMCCVRGYRGMCERVVLSVHVRGLQCQCACVRGLQCSVVHV